jgi:transcriptional regulator with XRE-family HTH domain
MMILLSSAKNSVRQWREQAQLSQEEFARRIGINRSYLSAIETGKLIPTPALAERICLELGKQPSLVFDV